MTPLWRQLQAVANVLSEVRAGRSLTAVLEAVAPDLRPGVQALSFELMRGLGRAQALRGQLARRAPPEATDALLCTALALAATEATPSYEPHTLVNQAVEAARRLPATRAQAGFVNACLRRFLRDREALLDAVRADPVALWNHPRWWIDRLRRDHGPEAEAILQADQAQAPMTLRVNLCRVTVEHARATLEAGGVAVRSVVGGCGLELEQPRPVHALPGFAEGWLSVQDAAAQLAAPLLLDGLDATRPLRVLDACAAPGGKTLHLLECRPDAEVLALDIDAGRCERITQNLARAGLSAQIRVADAGDPARWWDGRPFDAILLDAPCTASGIVRRHPDVRWLRRETDIEALAQQQNRLLDALWPLVRPGGRLLYATCSVFRDEGEGRVQAFLAHNTDALREPAPGHLLPRKPASGPVVPDNPWGGHDGFFYARWRKASLAEPGAGGPVAGAVAAPGGPAGAGPGAGT
jgi:16S rRNA (cytosine967-C5)-methyltransferase